MVYGLRKVYAGVVFLGRESCLRGWRCRGNEKFSFELLFKFVHLPEGVFFSFGGCGCVWVWYGDLRFEIC